MDIPIRQERLEDYQQIRELVRKAFALAEHSDGDEHNLIERLRLSPEYIPELSLVAVSGDIILGHIMFSKISVGQTEAIALAPLAVRSDLQRKGIQNSAMTRGQFMELLLLSMSRMNIIWLATLALRVIFPKEMSNIQMPLAYSYKCHGCST